jgi:hypothetical protein
MPPRDADLIAQQGSDLQVCYRFGGSTIGKAGDLRPAVPFNPAQVPVRIRDEARPHFRQ